MMSDSRDLTGRGGTEQPLTTSSSLVAGLKARDQQSWNLMVDLYLPIVHGWCARAGVPRADLADVVQDVFAAVARSVDGFRRDRPGDTFRGWLRGIARHKVLDYWRRNPAEGKATGGTDAQQRLANLQGCDEGESSSGDIPETSQLVRRALDRLARQGT